MRCFFEKLVMPDENFRIKSFIRTDFSYDTELHPHWHKEVEILFFLSGIASQKVNDRTFITEPGDVVIIGENQLHSTYSCKGSDSRILVIQFDAESLFKFENKDKDNHTPLFGNEVVIKNPLRKTDSCCNMLEELVAGIHEELTNMQSCYKYAILSYLYKIIFIIARNNMFYFSENSCTNLLSSELNLEKTFNLVNMSYSGDISLKTAANASNISVTHFCRLFKKTTGMTFKDYLTFYRVNKAEKMLGTRKSFIEIALDCGFGSVSSFVRSFKKYKKCTPSAYRKK